MKKSLIVVALLILLVASITWSQTPVSTSTSVPDPPMDSINNVFRELGVLHHTVEQQNLYIQQLREYITKLQAKPDIPVPAAVPAAPTSKPSVP